MRIYEANRNVLSERVKLDTRQLIAGQVLHIPAKDDDPAKDNESNGIQIDPGPQ